MAVVAAISCRLPHGTSSDCFSLFHSLPVRIPRGRASTRQPCRRRPAASVRFVLREVEWEEEESNGGRVSMADALIKEEVEVKGKEELRIASDHRMAERKVRKEAGRRTYLIAAVMSSLAITSMAVAAVYYRFTWQMECCRAARFRRRRCWRRSLSPWARRWEWSYGRVGRTGRCGTPLCGTCTSRTIARATAPSSSTTSSPSSTPSPPSPSRPTASSTPASSPVSASAPASGLRCSEWPTCSSTTAWSTDGSRWAPSPAYPTSAGSPPPTRSTT
ncbi:uncharacterized protein LOC121970105 isoform X3 [Zingiber officinale]|uniref:uncharacterized protein LOC121970105 isoform X3 n=1 Tax=Zingiber officinale TaxID=94328 RepID=UPI001C4DA36F|nr:uncharacterized protein LOC121970105 isoform X3 [Zingiber officinale]